MPCSKPGEIVLYTEVTTACTHRCDFCPIGHCERQGAIHPDVRRGVLKLISSDLSRRFIVYPHLTGEPLCYPELDGYVREIAALPNVGLWLRTKGVLLDEARLHGRKNHRKETSLQSRTTDSLSLAEFRYVLQERIDFACCRGLLEGVLAEAKTPWPSLWWVAWAFQPRPVINEA
jgi:wyosine [tRNA(Phe)-imidazoG37] synthetase (radical SAM superfamily)